jgi:hypothetical protein
LGLVPSSEGIDENQIDTEARGSLEGIDGSTGEENTPSESNDAIAAGSLAMPLAGALIGSILAGLSSEFPAVENAVENVIEKTTSFFNENKECI